MKIAEKIRTLKLKAQSLLENRGEFSNTSLESLKNEARALLEMAAKLQAKHQLSDAQVSLDSENSFNPVYTLFVVPQTLQQRVTGTWFQILMQCMAELYPVRIELCKVHGNKAKLFGDEQDIAIVVTLLDLLLERAELFLAELLKTLPELQKWHYLAGFSMGCRDALQKAAETSNKTSSIIGDISQRSLGNTALMFSNERRQVKLALLDSLLRDKTARHEVTPRFIRVNESLSAGMHDGLHHEKTRL